MDGKEIKSDLWCELFISQDKQFLDEKRKTEDWVKIYTHPAREFKYTEAKLLNRGVVSARIEADLILADRIDIELRHDGIGTYITGRRRNLVVHTQVVLAVMRSSVIYIRDILRGGSLRFIANNPARHILACAHLKAFVFREGDGT